MVRFVLLKTTLRAWKPRTYLEDGTNPNQASFFFANPLVALRVLLPKTILPMIHVIASAALVRATEHVVMSRVFCEET